MGFVVVSVPTRVKTWWVHRVLEHIPVRLRPNLFGRIVRGKYREVASLYGVDDRRWLLWLVWPGLDPREMSEVQSWVIFLFKPGAPQLIWRIIRSSWAK